MNRFVVVVFSALLVVTIIKLTVLGKSLTSHDDYVRERTVRLQGGNGMCTGTMIYSPINHKPYVLTAAHCSHLSEDGRLIHALTEAGQYSDLSIIAVDVTDDLMLLTNSWDKGLTLAETVQIHEAVRAIAWGDGEPPFVQSGEVLEAYMMFDNGGYLTRRMLTNVHIVPGASGGPLVNSDNQLVGIILVTYYKTLFSNQAPIEVILDFIKDATK